MPNIHRIVIATPSEPASIKASFSPSASGDSVSAAPKNIQANSGAVSGTSAVPVTSVISASVESRPISAASAGAAIIGEATACSISARNRSGEDLSMPAARQPTPISAGTAIMVQAEAASTMPGRRRWSRNAAMSTRMNEMHSSRKIASAT